MTLVVGKVIKMPAMRKGLCRYVDKKKDGTVVEETILLSNETLEEMAKTIHGIPVVIDHHADIGPGNIEQLTVGRVADMHYDQEQDLWSPHFVVDDEDAVSKLQNGWGVSTAYRITSSGAGGTLNNVPYNREVTGAVYDHLAIVQNPRYEMARDPIFYNSKDSLKTPEEEANISNSNQKRGGSMLGKLWRMVREEFKVNEGEELFVMIDGKEMKLNDVTQAVHDAEMKQNMKKVIMNGSDEVEYNGVKMTVNDLVEKFKKNEDEKKENEDKEAKEKEEAEKKENEAKAEEEKKANEAKEKEEAEKKENEAKAEEEKKANEAKEAEEKLNFNSLKNVKENAASGAPVQEYVSLNDRLAAGRKQFGSK